MMLKKIRPFTTNAAFLTILSIAGVFLLAAPCRAQAPVPSVYQDLYNQLQMEINDFDGAIASMWDGSKYPVAFSGQLTSANSNNGPNLLSGVSQIETEIDYLKSVGVKAISMEVSFPMLYQPFMDAAIPNGQAQFTTFYQTLANYIHSQGMQVIVESQTLIPTGLDSTWAQFGLQQFYGSFASFQDYINARAQTVGVVASALRPDYFVMQEEPDTESHQASEPMAETVDGSTMMLDASIMAARAANVPGMKIGAGFGTWLQAFQLFANSFTQQLCGQMVMGPAGAVMQPCISQPLDFLDLHIFPITEHTQACSPTGTPCAYPNFWQNALAVVATAKNAGKPMSISQTWLRKVRDSEWLVLPDGGGIEEAREAYSFWQPLDAAFLKTIRDLANYSKMVFVVPFNTQNIATYIDWSPSTALMGEGGTLSPADVFGMVQMAALPVISSKGESLTGNSYHSLAQGFLISLATADQEVQFAPESIVAAYGANLTTVTAAATAPLSTNLDGTTVTVTDSAGMARPAYIFYVSPSQVNYVIPKDSAPGAALVTITSANGATTVLSIRIASTSPGLFALNTSGLVAAWVLPVVSGTQQPLQAVFQVSGNSVVAKPVSLGGSNEQVYLELFGTGIRDAASVMVSVGGINVPVLFSGPAPGYTGLDQVNVGPLPSSLAGKGKVDIVLTAGGQSSNTVNMTIQ